MQETDPSHSFGLRAAEECDEFAPSHAKLPVEDEAYQRAELCITAKICRRWQRWVNQRRFERAPGTSASLIGRLGSSTFRLSTATELMSLTGSCFSSESALRPFHHGIRRRGGTIFTAALPSNDSRSKRTCELTSSIVPRGTSFHRSVDLDFPPIAFDLDQPSCRCDVPCPAELSTVNPDAVHDHGQPTC